MPFITAINDTPPWGSDDYVEYVVHWESVTFAFEVSTVVAWPQHLNGSNGQETACLSREETTVLLFHSVAGGESIRLSLLREFYLHWLMCNRKCKVWDELEPLVAWIASNCPRYRMTEEDIREWREDAE